MGSRALGGAFELVFAAATLATITPLFVARYVPIQDLPQHAAAVRVLFDYHDPELGFARFFERTPASTQYLSVYALAGLLSTVFDAVTALKLVIAGALLALPYALGAVLGELRKPRSYALFALPLAYNAHLVLGFVNFVAALPLMFWGIALALQVTRAWSWRSFAGLALVSCLCFYTHVVPYGVLALACALLFSRLPARDARRALAALGPSALAALFWLFRSPAGEAVRALLGAGGSAEQRSSAGPRAVFLSFEDAARELPEWFIDVFRGSDDEHAFLLWSLVAAALLVAGARRRRGVGDALASSRRRLALLAPALFLGYFVAPASYGFMWPIHARFPLLALLLAIPAFPRVAPAARLAFATCAVGLTVWTAHTARSAFRDASIHKYGGLEPIAERVPAGSRVAGLIFDRGSRFVKFSPYLHAVAWLQAERGGAVMFTFADFPHSPFRFRPEDRPPHVPPRWEWLPERVDPETDLAWFEYVLTRGGPALRGFRRVARAGEWSLWRR